MTKGMITLLNTTAQPPEYYTQYPGGRSPAEIFGGTWELQFNDESIFFRTEGGDAKAFGEGVQEDSIGPHNHQMTFRRTDKSGNHTATVLSYSENRQGLINIDTASMGAGIKEETRPKNRTFRIWKNVLL